MAMKWGESDTGFVNSKGQTGVWVKEPEQPKAPTGDNNAMSVTNAVQGNPYENYYNKMAAMYERQLAEEKARQERVKQARINAANTTYDTSMANLKDATNSSLRQAYIKHMQEQKALPQQMQAYGLSGGTTETTLANMKNVYGTNRANIQQENLVQQRMIEQDRANAIASAESDAANYEASAVREYNNGLLDLYASALSDAQKQALSASNAATKKQESNLKALRNSAWYGEATRLLGEGYSQTEIIDELMRRGASGEILDSIFSDWESTI